MKYSVLEKRSNVAGEVPQVEDLMKGQIAINFADRIIYGLDDNAEIVQLTLASADLAPVAFSGNYYDLSNLPSGGSGSVWYTGYTGPSYDIGVNGDYYLNVSNSDYFSRSNDTWNLIGNFAGPSGEPGPQGLQGVQGVPGVQGPAGSAALSPYDIGGSIFGIPDDSVVVMRMAANRSFTLPSNFTGSRALCASVATATTILTIFKNGVSIGTMTYAANGRIGTFAGIGASFVAGDELTVSNQATADTTFGNAEFTFMATLN